MGCEDFQNNGGWGIKFIEKVHPKKQGNPAGYGYDIFRINCDRNVVSNMNSKQRICRYIIMSTTEPPLTAKPMFSVCSV